MPRTDYKTKSMKLVYAELQIQKDKQISNEIHELTEKQEAIKKRTLAIEHLLGGLNAYKDETGIVSLDAFSDSISIFQEKHFPDICRENKFIVTEDQNPFPAEFEIDNVDPKTLDHCIDKLYTLAEHGRYETTNNTRHLKENIDNHHLFSAMAAHGATLNGMEDTSVRNQTKSAG